MKSKDTGDENMGMRIHLPGSQERSMLNDVEARLLEMACER